LINSQYIKDLDVHLVNVSNGSTFDVSMSFVWSMALSNGTKLVTCLGSAYEATQSSFHAEGYGMLALVRYFHHLFEYSASNPTWKIKLICDNEGIITRLSNLIQYTECFPNNDHTLQLPTGISRMEL
jgi:hypothetical protein